jgi:hypothetical protein
LPVPVTRNRLFAPLCVSSSAWLRSPSSRPVRAGRAHLWSGQAIRRTPERRGGTWVGPWPRALAQLQRLAGAAWAPAWPLPTERPSVPLCVASCPVLATAVLAARPLAAAGLAGSRLRRRCLGRFGLAGHCLRRALGGCALGLARCTGLACSVSRPVVYTPSRPPRPLRLLAGSELPLSGTRSTATGSTVTGAGRGIGVGRGAATGLAASGLPGTGLAAPGRAGGVGAAAAGRAGAGRGGAAGAGAA